MFVSVYTERAPIPRKTVHKWNDDGSVGELIKDKNEGMEGVVRSVEATLHLTTDQARAFHAWLGEQIAALEGIKDTQNGND
jgi:hypothetical protein